MSGEQNNDEREALAAVYLEFSSPNYRAWTGGVSPHEALRNDQRFFLNEKALAVADAILAAGFRHRGPITNAMVEAVWHTLELDEVGHLSRSNVRAALEAAERAR